MEIREGDTLIEAITCDFAATVFYFLILIFGCWSSRRRYCFDGTMVKAKGRVE